MDYTIRRAENTPGDLALIAHHRRAMFIDIGHGAQPSLQRLDEPFLVWAKAKMAADRLLTWFAVASDGEVAAGVGIYILDMPPTVFDLTDERAYLLNVYTEPAHRRQGLARRLVDVAMDYCQTAGFRSMLLHASEFGRPLYETLGFVLTNEMRFQFRKD
ncbi:MAG TPA: GNAT family N-acetyltransferase [Aggregatilineales bacterium]|nr:GNAT family N-acetyltransferase [Anaerolineales bacterium]HRE48257.1 GNAT family N-acetyltransferase [Aggregatilineales bacterium]